MFKDEHHRQTIVVIKELNLSADASISHQPLNNWITIFILYKYYIIIFLKNQFEEYSQFYFSSYPIVLFLCSHSQLFS